MICIRPLQCGQASTSIARALHPVEQSAVLGPGEPVERERRSQEVAAEPFQTLAVPGVDADARVEGKAALEGAAACLLEGLRVPQPPVHLGGLQGPGGIEIDLFEFDAQGVVRKTYQIDTKTK